MPKRRACSGYAKSIGFLAFLFLTNVCLAQDDCAELFKSNVFPPPLVNIVLEKFQIPPENWASINRDLTIQLQKIDDRVHKKAALLTPNPFKEPKQTVVIGRLYQETRLEIFEEVMREHGVEEKRQIHDMFDQIQYEKAQRIWECYREKGRR